jgi:hypothetical protein
MQDLTDRNNIHPIEGIGFTTFGDKVVLVVLLPGETRKPSLQARLYLRKQEDSQKYDPRG